MSDDRFRVQAITCPIIRLASGSSRVFAWLRPRCARLTPLTRPSVEPGPGIYVMARQVHGRFDIGLDSKEGKRRCREHGHLFAATDPLLVGLNTLQNWLWQRLAAPLEEQQAQLAYA